MNLYLRRTERHRLDGTNLRRSRCTVTVVALSGSVRESLVRTGESTDLRVHGGNVEQVVSGRCHAALSVTTDETVDSGHA